MSLETNNQVKSVKNIYNKILNKPRLIKKLIRNPSGYNAAAEDALCDMIEAHLSYRMYNVTKERDKKSQIKIFLLPRIIIPMIEHVISLIFILWAYIICDIAQTALTPEHRYTVNFR